MAQGTLEAQIIARLERDAAAHGVDIVDVEVVGSKRAPVVRVRIDTLDEDAPTITLEEVSAQTGWISEALDDMDPIPGAYTLEVSSPGMSRPLRKPHDFERFAGEQVSLTTTAAEGRRHYTGTLVGLVDGEVRLDCDDGTHGFSLEEIKNCHIKPDFDAPAKPGHAAKR